MANKIEISKKKHWTKDKFKPQQVHYKSVNANGAKKKGFYYLLTFTKAYVFLVSKETVVRVGGRVKPKFGFIQQVDEGWITTVKDLESWHFKH